MKKCDMCGSTAVDHTEMQCQLNRLGKRPFMPPTGIPDVIPEEWTKLPHCSLCACPKCINTVYMCSNKPSGTLKNGGES